MTKLLHLLDELADTFLLHVEGPNSKGFYDATKAYTVVKPIVGRITDELKRGATLKKTPRSFT